LEIQNASSIGGSNLNFVELQLEIVALTTKYELL
jgi:predicted  nucleic acid-binding Zn-ribbon protein